MNKKLNSFLSFIDLNLWSLTLYYFLLNNTLPMFNNYFDVLIKVLIISVFMTLIFWIKKLAKNNLTRLQSIQQGQTLNDKVDWEKNIDKELRKVCKHDFNGGLYCKYCNKRKSKQDEKSNEVKK